MPRRPGHDETLYLDEAEGFLLEHALLEPHRSWRPAPAEQPHRPAQPAWKKVDWDEEMRAHPDEPLDYPLKVKDEDAAEANTERCVICLMALRDRTVVGVCGHEFCFECIGVWANQSRRCPLCSADMAPFLLHDLDNAVPTKFYLPPLPQRQLPSMALPASSSRRPVRQQEREKVEPDELDLQVERRREIYQHALFAKVSPRHSKPEQRSPAQHIASNTLTRFRPNPTPRQIADDPVLIQRATVFMRRELRVWSLVDVEFLTTYILSLLKAIDIRSDPAIRLLAEFLDPSLGPQFPHGAEHFAHELYSFLRSPFKELRRYDEVAQYDPNPETRSRSPSPSLSAPRRDAVRSVSASPSRPYSLSPRKRSRSRSGSREHSPRDWHTRDTFIAPPDPTERRWDESDTWIDPEYAHWLDEEKQRAEDRKTRRLSVNGSKMRAWEVPVTKAEPIELLPSPSPKPLRMDGGPREDFLQEQRPSVGLTIKGSAVPKDPESRRLSLLERLANAKAQQSPSSPITNGHHPPSPVPADMPTTLADRHAILLERLARAKAEAIAANAIVQEVLSSALPMEEAYIEETDQVFSPLDDKDRLRARIRLRTKLELEKASLRKNVNESKAQELRRRLLEAKAKRDAEETDSVLKRMDRAERAAEIRRRLMAVKMMAAETEAERKARELKERLLSRKKSMAGGGAAIAHAVEAY